MIPTDVSFADPASAQPIRRPPAVYTRDRWADDWEFASFVWAESLNWNCGPAIPTAQLRWVYGRQRVLSQVGAVTSEEYDTVDKKHWSLPRYVKLTCDTDYAPDGTSTTSRKWYGLIEVVADQIEGLAQVVTGYTGDGEPILQTVVAGQQLFTCFGIEQLLARHQILTSRFDRGAGAETTRERICFNAHGKPNRGITDHSGAKVFYFQPNDKPNCSFWSTRDIVQYLLRYQTPRDSLNARQITFECDDLAKLPNWDAPVLEQDGATTQYTRTGTFTTGAAATLDRMDVTAGYLNGTAGTGTGTMDITTTAGTSVCAVTVDCSTMATAGTTFANASCATPALAADTAYQVRVKSQCAGAGSFGYLIVAARMIIR